MSVRPFLGLALAMFLAVGCASSTESTSGDEATAIDDAALRALRPGDIDVGVLSGVAAKDAPEKFADIKSWNVDYVEMNDTVPENNYKGLMVFGQDADGQTIYFAPLGYIGKDALATELGAPTTSIFHAASDEDGNLVPVTFALARTNDRAKVIAEKAAFQWVQSEQKRLLDLIQEQGKTAGASTQSLGIQTSFWGKALFCTAHIAAMFAAVSPVTYFLADGAISLVEGAVDAMTDPKKGVKEMTSGGMMSAAGGAMKGVKAGVVKSATKGLEGEAAKAAAEAAAKKLATKGRVLGGVAVAGVVAYNMYDKGVVGGLAETAKELVPSSCRDVYNAVTSK